MWQSNCKNGGVGRFGLGVGVCCLALTLAPRPADGAQPPISPPLRGESLTNLVRTYTVNKRVSDFPTNEDLSTPEAAYATFNRISASGEQGRWRSLSVKRLADRLPAGDTKKIEVRPSAAKEWLAAEILEVQVYREKVAMAFAKVPHPSKSIIDIRSFELESGRWLNSGNDVRGSLEAIQSALMGLGNEEVRVNVVAGSVGGITETDVNLALTTGAVIFGFNVRADNAARRVVESEGVDLRYYSVIYDLIDDVKSALSGMLKPELREEILGVAEVRDTFSSPKFGTVAGCMVIEGTVYRHKRIRVLRADVVIYEGELESLRRFKEDVAEVRAGFECGIGVRNYNDVRVGDKIEVYSVREIARTL